MAEPRAEQASSVMAEQASSVMAEQTSSVMAEQASSVMAEPQSEKQSWTLCISGDVDRVFIVSVSKENGTVAKLKAVIEQRLSVPVEQQTLYFQEQVMHDDSVLSSISGLDHGAMVYLSRCPFSLTICSWLSGSLEEVLIKLNYNIVNQPVSSLKRIICQRFGVNVPMLVCGEEIIDASYDDTLLCDSVIADGAVVILHKMPVTVSFIDQDTSFDFYVPQSMTRGFLKQQLSVSTGSTVSQIESGVFSSNTKRDPHSVKKSTTNSVNTTCENYFAKTADNHQVTKPYDIKRKGWGLDVQRLDGTKLSVHVECCENTPIVKLREYVEKCTGVPTHQQRLTIGSTIVEDWDDEDRMMFIGDYPNIHDGSLLYLVQLEGGSRMKVEFCDEDYDKYTVQLSNHWPVEYCYETHQFYVNHIKSFDDLVAKMMKKQKIKIKDKVGNDMGESVGPDYVVYIFFETGRIYKKNYNYEY